MCETVAQFVTGMYTTFLIRELCFLKLKDLQWIKVLGSAKHSNQEMIEEEIYRILL